MRYHHQAEHKTGAWNAILNIKEWRNKVVEFLDLCFVLPLIHFCFLNLLGNIFDHLLEAFRDYNESFVKHGFEQLFTLCRILEFFKLAFLFIAHLILFNLSNALVLQDSQILISKFGHEFNTEHPGEGAHFLRKKRLIQDENFVFQAVCNGTADWTLQMIGTISYNSSLYYKLIFSALEQILNRTLVTQWWHLSQDNLGFRAVFISHGGWQVLIHARKLFHSRLLVQIDSE